MRGEYRGRVHRRCGARRRVRRSALPSVDDSRARVSHARRQTGTVVSNASVVVTGTRIVAAGANVATPSGATVIDLGDVLLMPGLIDSHTHLLQNYNGQVGSDDPNMLLTVAALGTTRRALLGVAMGRQDLEAGITTVRDLGNSGWNGDVALRDAINSGWVVGPRIMASTRALAAAGGQFGGMAPEAQKLIENEYVVISGVEEARRAVRQAFYDGADLIKVIVNTGPRVVSLDELKVIVEEAHRVGKRVAAHATTDQATRSPPTPASTRSSTDIRSRRGHSGDEREEHRSRADRLSRVILRRRARRTAITPEQRTERMAGAQPFVTRSADRLMRAVQSGRAHRLRVGRVLRRTRAHSRAVESSDAAGVSGGRHVAARRVRAATINSADLLGLGDRIGRSRPVSWRTSSRCRRRSAEGRGRDLQHVRFVMKGGQVVRNDPASREMIAVAVAALLAACRPSASTAPRRRLDAQLPDAVCDARSAVGVSGSIALRPISSPFGVAVTVDGRPRYHLVATIAGLPEAKVARRIRYVRRVGVHALDSTAW